MTSNNSTNVTLGTCTNHKLSSGNTDWTLQCCCSSVQTQVIVFVSVSAVLLWPLFNTTILLPLRLICVVLHEFGHASAVICTGGSVERIEVKANISGVTHSRGGNRFITLSAGYLGSSFWGCVFIVSAANNIASQIAAGCLSAVFWACQILQYFNGLQYYLLFIGTLSAIFACYDVWETTVKNKIEESDAVQLAILTHTSSRCWGIIWCVLSILLFMGSVYLCLVVLSS